MKSLLESITAVNEVNDQDFNSILNSIKALFCYDKLSFMEKDIVADMFRSSTYSGGVIYEQIHNFWKNTDKSKADKNKIYKSIEMCKKIHEALKP